MAASRRSSESPYDEQYFEIQRRTGVLGGRLNQFKFAGFINPDDRVLDFGCGGGFLLSQLDCAERAGIEINPAAREQAAQLGITTYASIQDVPDGFATVLISNHALEHVPNPEETLRALQGKLAPGGRVVIVVPHDPMLPFSADDPDHHLYTWTPLTLGNLLQAAGYEVERAEVIHHRWPPKAPLVHRLVGMGLFHALSRLWSRLTGVCQVRVVARRI